MEARDHRLLKKKNNNNDSDDKDNDNDDDDDDDFASRFNWVQFGKAVQCLYYLIECSDDKRANPDAKVHSLMTGRKTRAL